MRIESDRVGSSLKNVEMMVINRKRHFALTKRPKMLGKGERGGVGRGKERREDSSRVPVIASAM